MGPQNEEPVVSRRACVVRTVHKCPMPECTYISDRRSNVERHYATMHVNCLPLQQASCCGLNFIDKQAYRTHQKTAHTLGYCCGTCGKRFKTKHHYSLHSGTHDRAHNFFCTYPECGYNTSRKGNFRRHIAVHDAALIRDAGISLSSNDFGDSSAAFGFPPNIQGIPEFADGSGRSEYAAATDNRNVNVPEMPRTDGANDIYTTQQDYEKCEGYGSNGDMGPLEGQLDENSVVQNAEPLKGFPCRMCNKRFAMWKHAFKHVCTCG